MSSGFKDCSHALNFVFARFLFLVLPVAFKHFSCLSKKYSSHELELVTRQDANCADGNKDVKIKTTLLILRQQAKPS